MIRMKKFENIPAIIPSMDVGLEDLKRILSQISDLSSEIGGLKIGSLLVWKYGLQKIVNEIKATCDFPIIFDAQKAGTDIPPMVEEQVRLASDMGVDALVAATLGAGSKSLESFIKTSFECNLVPIIVLEMTHPMANAFLKEDAGEEVLALSLKMGVENFVAPATNPKRIRLYRNLALKMGKTIKIMSPGVGPQGSDPDTAAKAGADFVIVGRAIYQAKEPRVEVIHIYDLIKKGYQKRN